MAQELKQQPKMTPVEPPAPPSPGPSLLEQRRAELAALKEQAELEAMEAEIAALKKKVSAPKRAAVSGTFRLTQPHYRDSVMYQPGDIIRIENEVPGASWVPVDLTAPAPAPAVVNLSAGRPSDRSPV